MKKICLDELKFCLDLWEKQGHCTFGKKTNCAQCAAPYVLWKLLTGQVIHGPAVTRLDLNAWKEKLQQLT